MILRLREVTARTSLHRATIYRMIRSGDFPKPVRLSALRVGWYEHDVQRWIETRSSNGHL